jgi:glycosyltransferase involved in cell wall biosynthesis
MKTVVMIAYNYPPDGSAGVYRPLRFLRHLPEMGWSATVIAAELAPGAWTRYDPTLLALAPDEVGLIRVRSRDPWQAIQALRARRMRDKLAHVSTEAAERIHTAHRRPFRAFLRERLVRTVEAWCYHPDMAGRWIPAAVEATVRACANRKPHAICATGGPWSSFIVARRASQRTGVPFVLDFQDSWTLSESPFERRRPEWAIRADRRTLERLVKSAQAVIFRYESEAECYRRAYGSALDPSKIHLIPNGYDGSIERFVPPADDTRCRILYAGTLTPYRHDTLLQALHALKRTNSARAQHLRVMFVGDGMEELRKDAARLELLDIVDIRGVLSYAEVTRLQQCAHALLVLGLKPVRGHEFCGSKVFGYLQAGRPIVGVLPADESRSVLKRVGVSTIADIDSVPEIVHVFRHIVDAWATRTLASLVPNPTACELYTARRQTAAFVRALEGAPPAEPFVPGVAEVPPSLRQMIGDRGWIDSTP